MRRKGEVECTEERKDSCGKFLRDWVVLSKGHQLGPFLRTVWHPLRSKRRKKECP